MNSHIYSDKLAFDSNVPCSRCINSSHVLYCNCPCVCFCYAYDEIFDDESLSKNISYFVNLNIPFIVKALVIKHLRILINQEKEERRLAISQALEDFEQRRLILDLLELEELARGTLFFMSDFEDSD